MPIAPPALVVGATRQALPFGLFSTFTFRPGNAGRWENGVDFETDPCTGAGGIGPLDCDVPPAPLNLARDDSEPGSSVPFTVYGHFRCSPVGWNQAAADARAVTHLLNREEARVEQALWTGDLGNTPRLATPETEVLGGGVPVKPAVGIGLLEKWLGANYDSLGLIHAPRDVAGLIPGAAAAGGVLRTLLGTPVAAGAGYPGTSPTGAPADAGAAWVYASPALFGYRTDVFTPSGDMFDRARNDIYAIAERTYLLGFDPCGVAAVQISGGL